MSTGPKSEFIKKLTYELPYFTNFICHWAKSKGPPHLFMMRRPRLFVFFISFCQNVTSRYTISPFFTVSTGWYTRCPTMVCWFSAP